MENNKKTFESVLDIRKSISQQFFLRSENAGKHNSFEQELREMESIENGDEKRLSKTLAEIDEKEIGILAKDPLRHHKNVAIGNVTLASRAAIRGGVSAEVSFSMADIFIQQIENMTDIDEIIMYKKTLKLIYAQTVKEIRDKGEYSKNPLIKEVKNYIFTHMHDTIQVSAIAEYYHVNADYLSHLFSSHEKKTIKQYILEEKIARSKNLLKYSNYKIQDIAFYLGFKTYSLSFYYHRWFFRIPSDGREPSPFRLR